MRIGAEESTNAAWPAADKGAGRWWSHVQFLADDRFEGRQTGSQGHRKAAEYLAGKFEELGLQPGGTHAYFQPVQFRTRRIVEKDCGLALVREGAAAPLTLGEDAIISTRVDPADSIEAPLVFAGYGLTVPEASYDDLAGLDLRNKVVVYLGGGPSFLPGPLRSHYHSALERNRFLRQAGAIGFLMIPNPKNMDIPWTRMATSRFQVSMSLADPALDENAGLRISVTMNPAHAGKLFANSGHTMEELLEIADAGTPLPTFPLACSVSAKVRVDRAEVESANVAAILPGSDPVLKNEHVVLSAHLDHVGIGEPIHGDRIYHGAMDNASGVATLLEVAAMLRDSGVKLRRSLLLLAPTGEEMGLLGSRYFATYPTVKSMVANLNIDTVLPLFPLKFLTVYGLNESDLGAEVRGVAERHGVLIQDDPEPIRNLFVRADQYSFIRRGVPALAFKVGYEEGTPEEQIAKAWLRDRYHAPADDGNQPVNLECAAQFNAIMAEFAERLANRGERPQWNSNSFFRRFSQD